MRCANLSCLISQLSEQLFFVQERGSEVIPEFINCYQNACNCRSSISSFPYKFDSCP